MQRMLAMASLLLALAACGGTKPAARWPGERTLIRCPHCGMEYPVEEGLKSYEQHHAP